MYFNSNPTKNKLHSSYDGGPHMDASSEPRSARTKHNREPRSFFPLRDSSPNVAFCKPPMETMSIFVGLKRIRPSTTYHQPSRKRRTKMTASITCLCAFGDSGRHRRRPMRMSTTVVNSRIANMPIAPLAHNNKQIIEPPKRRQAWSMMYLEYRGEIRFTRGRAPPPGTGGKRYSDQAKCRGRWSNRAMKPKNTTSAR